MTLINDFIIANYSWILIIVIIILLAIIGSYADKTNFGEGKKNYKDPEDDKEKIDLSNKKLSDLIPNSGNAIKQEKESNNDETYNNSTLFEQQNIETVNQQNLEQRPNFTNSYNIGESTLGDNTNIEEPSVQENKQVSLDSFNSIEDKLSKLDEEISGVLPKRDEFDSSILDELEDLSLDSKSNFDSKIKDGFNLDDLKLPDIKSLKEESDDIWNYKY